MAIPAAKIWDTSGVREKQLKDQGKAIILLVDDDKEVCDFITIALGSNYKVFAITDPNKIEEELQNRKPNIILLDQNMPTRSGIEICESIRKHSEWDTLPIIFISALTQQECLLNYYKAGANFVIPKPFDLRELQAIVKVWVAVNQRGMTLQNENSTLSKLSKTDPLTGLFNRRYGLDVLDRELARHKRYGNNSSLLFIDINNFKKANDLVSHNYGDQILTKTAQILSSALRDSDICIRYGGDEFMAILIEASITEGNEIKKRILKTIRDNPISDKPELGIGLSIGISSLNNKISSVSEWIENADKDMYVEKTSSQTLPAVSIAEINNNAKNHNPNRPPVFILDSNDQQRTSLAGLIHSGGYPVQDSNNSNKLLSIRNDKPTQKIIIINKNLQTNNVNQICNTLRINYPTTYQYIIIMNDKDTINENDEILNSGADNFILKPYNKRELRNYLESAVRIFNIENSLSTSAEKLKTAQSAITATERQRVMGLIAGGIAHDFNNINMAILGYTHLILNKKNIDDRLRNYVEAISEAASDSSDLAARLTDFSRLSRPEQEPCRIKEVVTKTIKLIKHELETTGVTVVLEYNDTEKIEVRKGDISQVILNIIINADHAMRDVEEKRITITTDSNSEESWCTITDTGSGISPENIQKIFQPLYSTKGQFCKDIKSTQKSITGTGLGLSTSETIIREHGGRITVNSEEGKGSTFTIFIPNSKKQKSPTTILPQKKTATNCLLGINILIVDDEPVLRDIMRITLTPTGANIRCAENGKKGIDCLREKECDLVITDLQMPFLDGWKMIEQIKKDATIKEPQWIVITGRVDSSVKELMEKYQIKNLLTKPFSPTSLLSLIEKNLKAESI